MTVPTEQTLPVPFGPEAWPTPLTEAAGALWAWHLGLAEAGTVPPEVAGAAEAACRAHSLPEEWLNEQAEAAARLQGAVRFETRTALQEFVRRFAGAHARLLAHLAGQTGAWQQAPTEALAYAFFLTGHLARLPGDLARDRLFLPLEALDQAGVSVTMLREGPPGEAVRKLLWRQTVRARDAFARGLDLGKDLDGWQRRRFRQAWLGGLEVLAEIERRRYDVWAQPVGLGRMQRLRIRLQAFVGKAGR